VRSVQTGVYGPSYRDKSCRCLCAFFVHRFIYPTADAESLHVKFADETVYRTATK
jgi:hypothetical protein